MYIKFSVVRNIFKLTSHRPIDLYLSNSGTSS